jgi:hypothetical protein
MGLGKALHIDWDSTLCYFSGICSFCSLSFVLVLRVIYLLFVLSTSCSSVRVFHYRTSITGTQNGISQE